MLRTTWALYMLRLLAPGARGPGGLSIFLLAFSLSLLGSRAAAAANIYALFVGIDAYEDGSAPSLSGAPASALSNLQGAKADVSDLVGVLGGPKYGLSVSDPPRTIILMDKAATRDAILNALRQLIVRASSDHGATLLFYYSGHGARTDDQLGDQASGFESTIVPYDGRIPGRPMRDILGRELRVILDQANGAGVNVVTVFDSCNSGSATRGFQPVHVRAAPAYVRSAGVRPLPPLGLAPSRVKGVRVHLAAAQSAEAATERATPKGWRGDFTAALSQTLREAPAGYAYNDLMDRVVLKLQRNGVAEHPHAEGALNTHFLGQDHEDIALYAAEPDSSGMLAIAGGTLSGVTDGSTFSVFNNQTLAIDGKGALAVGEVEQAGISSARLKLTRMPATALNRTVWLRELTHNFTSQSLKIHVETAAGGDDPMIAAVSRDLSFVELSPVETATLVLRVTADGAQLETIDGAPIASGLKTQEQLRSALGKAARYFALFSLGFTGSPLHVRTVLSGNCSTLTGECAPLLRDDGGSVVDEGSAFHIGVVNEEKHGKFYVYLFDLASDLAVTLLYPPAHDAEPLAQNGGGVDLDPKGFCASIDPHTVAAGKDGREHLLLVASDTPVDMSALAQGGVGSRGRVSDPLSRLIADANTGRRGPPVAIKQWSASLTTLRVRRTAAHCKTD